MSRFITDALYKQYQETSEYKALSRADKIKLAKQRMIDKQHIKGVEKKDYIKNLRESIISGSTNFNRTTTKSSTAQKLVADKKFNPLYLLLGLLPIGGYFIYKKLKKNKN